jgi:hypothetical protein
MARRQGPQLPNLMYDKAHSGRLSGLAAQPRLKRIRAPSYITWEVDP